MHCLQDESDDLQIICSVDVFGEGVDIPSVSHVLFLRPTQSFTVFLQQLGRGLRIVPEKEYLVPIGKADVKKEGTDVTVIATSRMVHESLKAAEILSQEDINTEVIDLRSISPWDKQTVFDSVSKTHRLVIAHEAVKNFGVGAEISATAAEEIMSELDAPIMRVGAPFVPVPFSLENAYLPSVEDVISAVKRTLERSF